jgi:hypothetical protein
MDVIVCPECRVPELFNLNYSWLDNGDIVMAANQAVRLAFIECENLDPLFRQIGEIIGLPIEPLVVEITTRGAARFMESIFPKAFRDALAAKQIPIETFGEVAFTACHLMGYGKYEQVDMRYEGDENDYSTIRVDSPFSVPEAAGSITGVITGALDVQGITTYELVSPSVYEFTARLSASLEDRSEKMPLIPYTRENGDLELDRCPSCAAPKGLKEYRWELERGLIVNKLNGHRMAVLGPENLEALFAALEDELGETVPATVIEAQRRFTKTGFYSVDRLSDETDFRTELALRGLGNLQEIRMGPPGLFMIINNATGHLLTVGMVQGLFEMIFDVESSVDWALGEENKLEVQVSPKS